MDFDGRSDSWPILLADYESIALIGVFQCGELVVVPDIFKYVFALDSGF